MPGSASTESDSETTWRNAVLAAVVFAVDPQRLGGVAVRSRAGPVRDVWLKVLRSYLPEPTPFLRMPAQIGEDRLIGGLDLAATLKRGRPVRQRGLLAEADGGIILAAMAERLPPQTVAHIVGAQDRGTVVLEREGISDRVGSSFAVVAFDEGLDTDETLDAALADRLACHVDLDCVPLSVTNSMTGFEGADIVSARRRLDAVEVPDEVIDALAAASIAFGIASLRAPLLALRVARVAAALRGDQVVHEADVQTAARLVLAPRATQIPNATDDDMDEPGEQDANEDRRSESEPEEQRDSEGESLEDAVIDAVATALPKDLLASLCNGTVPARQRTTSGASGPAGRSKLRGRPIGVIPGRLGRGARLSIVDTLRAAAPWQRLRKRSLDGLAAPADHDCLVKVRPEDFRIKRYAQRSEALSIFVVDASGSTALHRLGEAKGAVELLLADCYVRRDHVALIVLRGRSAELLLPPTRALVRAKRCLAGMPGGGGTPLADGLSRATALALGAKQRAQQPTLILLTDGAANVARDGRTGRRIGEEDALAVSRQSSAYGIPAVLIDTAPRPAPFAARLAESLNARYYALPMADARTVSQIVKSTTAKP